MKEFDDKEICKMIRSGDERALTFVYKQHRAMIVKMVLKYGGSLHDANDVYHDTVTVFWKKVQCENFTLTCKISTFMYSIAKVTWIKELGFKHKSKSQNWHYYANHNGVHRDVDELEKKQLKDIYDECMSKMSAIGRKILEFHYFDDLLPQQIADEMGLKNSDTAKTAKYKYNLKFAEIVKSNYTVNDIL